MNVSTVGFKNPSADLHKKSPGIFLLCLIVSILFTTIVIIVPIPHKDSFVDKIEVPPVIIHLKNIPETRHRVVLPAPSIPFNPSGAVVEVDDILPDDVTIEDTILELDAAPEVPSAILLPSVGAAREENEIFEYFEVKEVPKRIEEILPVYPVIADRYGIEGTVTLKVLVNKIGAVDSVEVISDPSVFDKSAVEAAKATKFTPAKFNDRPVACWVIMPFKFQLDN